MVACFITVPIVAFRAPRAREYLETLPVPPHSTVYGLFCSVVGEPDRTVQVGAELAIAVIGTPPRSRVLRTIWRVKDAKAQPGLDTNRRPDLQELLTGVRLVAHLRPGTGERAPALAERVEAALRDPASVTRAGGLSLGESSFLVDELRLLRPNEAAADARWLVQDAAGPLALPRWVDHVGSAGTRYARFRLAPGGDLATPPEAAWVPVQPG